MVVSCEAKEQHAHASSGLRNHYSDLFTRMAALKFKNAVTKPPYQYHLAWLHQRSLNYLVCLLLSYLSHALIFCNEISVTIYLMYPLLAAQFIS